MKNVFEMMKPRTMLNARPDGIRPAPAPLTLIIATAICIRITMSSANATPIVYTFSGVDSGSVGSRTFNNAAFTVNVYGDTADVAVVGFTQGRNIYSVDASTATFTIAGIGSGVFAVGTRVFDAQGASQALGFSLSYALGGYDLWDFKSSVFWDYGLTTALGPINASPALWSPNLTSVPTTLGNLTFNYAPNIVFTATLVPEPSLISLWPVPVASLLLYRQPKTKGGLRVTPNQRMHRTPQ